MKRKTNPKDYPRMQRWQKQNMKAVAFKYKSEFVEEFRKACEQLGLKQSDVFRKAMNEVIQCAKGQSDTSM